ncbi:nitrilase-related carbon-nitrogen hydrolase [Desulfoplanes formicivorans]|nr:nitrilase-related carbon-nitrogen hydrolase [Desulfoplanes formicivorans]
MPATLDLALIQMHALPDRAFNLRTIDRLLEECNGCDLAVLPETAICLGNAETLRTSARSLDMLNRELGNMAAQHGMHVLFGGVPVRQDHGICNAALAYDPRGRLVARYDKIHLFQLDPDHVSGVDETAIYVPGREPVVWELNGWRICLSICYDIRFPELFRACAPVDLILCPMAFTARTGAAHGRLLLRARAVENQCYVGSASLCGRNEETGMELFGHSMAVDPWGEVVMDRGPQKEGVVRVKCAKQRIRAVRTTLPALRHMRREWSKEMDCSLREAHVR